MTLRFFDGLPAEARGGGVWEIELADAAARCARVRVAGEWLLLEASPARIGIMREADLAALMRWNARLPGGVKLVLADGEPPVRLRAELPLDDSEDLTRQMEHACADLARAGALMAATPGDDAPRPAPATFDPRPACRDSGWPFNERDSGELMIELDVTEGFEQAALQVDADGGTIVSLAVGGAPAADVCLDAARVLLLRTSAAVRLVRAAEGSDGGLRFEAACTAPGALTHALAALSVACRMSSREAAALLHDEAIARAYRARWFPTGLPTGSPR